MRPISHLIFDVDGVLLDWSRGFIKYMESCGQFPDSVVHRRWDMQCCWPHLSPDRLFRCIEAFHHTEAYGSLDQLPGALRGMQALGDRFPEAKRVAVTACGLDPKSLMLRLRSLQSFPLQEVHAVGVRESKKAMFSRFPADTSVVFEDRDVNAEVAYDLGMRVVLIDQPYNAHVEDRLPNFLQGSITRALGWGQMLKTIFKPELPKVGSFDVVD